MSRAREIAILGTVGVPGSYGGFETLAENLIRHDQAEGGRRRLTVACSARAYPDRPARFLHARLRYLPLDANGVQSIVYDYLALLSAAWTGADRVLLLGVSGATFLPLFRLISRAKVVTNIDGIEWRRAKWNGLARRVLRLSEAAAVRFSDVVIADNEAIRRYVAETYGAEAQVIAYGGDHALTTPPGDIADLGLPDRYALGLCRIEPENNVALLLEAFAGMPDVPLVFVGNWDRSDYGRALRARFGAAPNIRLVDPVYAPDRLRAVRDRAWLYLHGHAAGGTNPALVEMMHFGIPIAAFDCGFNRFTTEERARYFADAAGLQAVVREAAAAGSGNAAGVELREIARRRYTWTGVGQAYFDLLDP